MTATGGVVALLAVAATCSFASVIAARRGGRSLALIAVLVSTCLLAWGSYDWQAQTSIETDIKAYVLIGTLPIAVTAFTISILRRRDVRTMAQWTIGAVAFCASSVAVLFLSLVLNWVTI